MMKCSACGGVIHGVQHHSSLYMVPELTWLCKSCSDHEEWLMDQAGTNDLPELRESYSKPTQRGVHDG